MTPLVFVFHSKILLWHCVLHPHCLFVSLCYLCYYCLLFSSVVRHNHKLALMWLTIPNHKIAAPDLAPPDGVWYNVIKVLKYFRHGLLFSKKCREKCWFWSPDGGSGVSKRWLFCSPLKMFKCWTVPNFNGSSAFSGKRTCCETSKFCDIISYSMYREITHLTVGILGSNGGQVQ